MTRLKILVPTRNRQVEPAATLAGLDTVPSGRVPAGGAP